MKTYTVILSRKYTVWDTETHTVTAKSKKDAIDKAKNSKSDDIDYYIDYDSWEQMTEEDNDGNPVIEVVEVILNKD